MELYATELRVMVGHEDFTRILSQEGLPPVYRWDADVIASQQALPGSVGALEAFETGLRALFVNSKVCAGRDDFYSLVASEPEAFGLTEAASAEEIQLAIKTALSKDSDLCIQLLPDAGLAIIGAETMFPPEYGETVQDFWIWFIRSPGFFPGPAWILVRRDGSIDAYHYGYI